jgi:hypothetical protein
LKTVSVAIDYFPPKNILDLSGGYSTFLITYTLSRTAEICIPTPLRQDYVDRLPGTCWAFHLKLFLTLIGSTLVISAAW